MYQHIIAGKRASISGAHEQLKEELGAASGIIRENILGASNQLALTLADTGETLLSRINDSSAAIYDGIGRRMDGLCERISTSGEAAVISGAVPPVVAVEVTADNTSTKRVVSGVSLR